MSSQDTSLQRSAGWMRSGDHALLVEECRDDIRRWNAEAVVLGEARATTSTEENRWIGRITRKGSCLSVPPFTINGMEFGAQEWRNPLFLRYGIKTPDLLEHCDGCGAEFDVCHTLD